MTNETNWIVPEIIDARTSRELDDFPLLVRQLLFNRGVRTAEEARIFMGPSFKQLADPFVMSSMQSAVDVVESAIKEKKRIFIHGDFDADGISATALLWEYLYRSRRADVMPYIPSRIDEGYGMSEKSVEAIIKKGGQVIITVDCGVRDVNIVRKYRRSSTNPNGVDFVITDHHQPGKALPRYIPVVHPMHPKGTYPFQYLSGAAVAWMLCAAMEKQARGRAFSWERVPGLDLVAFSTVCDLMPLTGANRVLVHFGIGQMHNEPRIGLSALAREAGIAVSDIESYHIGYVLGPRINAAGRIGEPMDALRLFTTKNRTQAAELARKLGDLNRERQEMTDTLLNTIRTQIEQEGMGRHLYFAHGNDWPEGIIGLVAGKVQDMYHRPVVVVTTGASGSRGSARSIPAFNMIEAVEKFEHLLTHHGGHAQAAGFTVKEEKIAELQSGLESYAREVLTADDLRREMKADVIVDVGELDWDVMGMIKKLQPFGYGNRRPVFWMKNAVVSDARQVGDGKHVKLEVRGEKSGALDCIFFNAPAWTHEVAGQGTVDIMGYLEVNMWNGREDLQFRVTDMRKNS